MFDNVFLAQIVTFGEFTILLDTNELDMPFSSENYRLVAVFDDYAYDLETYNRTRVIKIIDGIIPDDELESIHPRIPYVYSLFPLNGFWESVVSVFKIKDKLDVYLNPRVALAKEIHENLTKDKQKGKVIDLLEAKQYINKRKF